MEEDSATDTKATKWLPVAALEATKPPGVKRDMKASLETSAQTGGSSKQEGMVKTQKEATDGTTDDMAWDPTAVKRRTGDVDTSTEEMTLRHREI